MATRLISQNWQVEGVLTAVTSATLADPTGTYGVKRNDTDAVVVASGTAMTATATGVYESSFTDVVGVSYTAYVKIVYAGATYYFEHDIPARAASSAATTTAGPIYTYYDALDAARDFIGQNNDSLALPGLKRAVSAAYRDICAAKDWSFLHKHGRINLQAPYTTGTITFDLTDGTYGRELTIADGEWPSWAATGVVRIDDVLYRVATRESDTVVTLHVDLCPTADVAAGTSYSLYPEYYLLPDRFERFDGPWGEATWNLGMEVSASSQLGLGRFDQSTGDTNYFAIRRVDDAYGRMGLYIHPPSDAAETLDFMYKCRPRDLRYSGHDNTVDSVGTITTNGTAAIVGSGTAFNSKMVGAVLRIGDTSNVPTALDGRYPYAEEHVIGAVTDTTHLTLATDSSLSTGSLKYCITDPLDLHLDVQNAFTRGVEKHLALVKNMKNKREIFAAYEEALFRAKGADSRSSQLEVAGSNHPLRDPRSAWFNFTDDVG